MTGITLQQKYDDKKAECVRRMIPFKFTFSEWEILHKLKNKLTCAYSGKKFRCGGNNPNRPTLERLSERPDIGYCKENVVWVLHSCNQMRNSYISLEGARGLLDRKGREHLQRIEKILGCQENIDRILEPYLSAYKNVEVKNSVLIKQQNIEKTKQQAIESEAKKWEDELSFAKHYISIVEELSNVGVDLQITLGTLKKSLGRCNKCQISGEVFTNIEDKWLFIINKSLPVTSDNVKVTTRNVRNAMDLLTRVCTIDKLALNIHKIQNKEK